MTKKHRVGLFVGLIFMLGCFVALLICYTNQAVSKLFYVEVNARETKERVAAWKDENGDYFVFLPGYANLSKARIQLDAIEKLYVNGTEMVDSESCDTFQLNTAYELSFSVLGKKRACNLTFVQSSCVATMYIDTESGSMEYIHGKKRNEEGGTLRLYNEAGGIEYNGELKSIAGRGNTTWDNSEKKPYTIDIGKDIDLLGMGAASDWVLLANAFDSSNMRNKLVFDMAKESGLAYSPEARWVDLYLNGEYEGLYLLSEQNEVHQERVALESPEGFLVSVERHGRMVTQNLPYVETNAKQTVRVRYPKEPTQETLLALERIWQSAENAILADDGIDSVTGKHWTDLIDLDSWVRKYLVEEVVGNFDANFISQFFYYDGNVGQEKIYAGPVWDYDLSMGKVWQTEGLDFWVANRPSVNDEFDTPWFYELYQKEEFQTCLKEIFSSEMILLIDGIGSKVDEYTNQISQAICANNIRWTVEGFAEEVEEIKKYFEQRKAFLSNVWLKDVEYHTIEARSEGVSYAYFAVKHGEKAVDLPILESTEARAFLGWYEENGELFDVTQPVYEDKLIYARWSGVSSTVSGYAQYFIPLAVIACMGVCVLWADIRRMRKGG